MNERSMSRLVDNFFARHNNGTANLHTDAPRTDAPQRPAALHTDADRGSADSPEAARRRMVERNKSGYAPQGQRLQERFVNAAYGQRLDADPDHTDGDDDPPEAARRRMIERNRAASKRGTAA